MLLYEDHDSIVTAIAFSPDGSLLATGSRNGSLILRDAFDNATPLWPPGSKIVGILNLAFLSADRLLVVHDLGWEVLRQSDSLWPVVSRGEQFSLTYATPLSESLLAIGTGDRLNAVAGMFYLHDLKTGRTLQPIFRENHGVRSIAVSPANKLVAWSTGGREVKVWDIKKQSPLAIRTSHTAWSLALAPDSSAVAFVQDWTVRVYDLNAKQDRPLLKGHKGIISSLAFSPDGLTVATGSWDGTVRFWDPRTGHERAVFQWPVGKGFSLAFSPDGQRAAAGGDGGAVVVWDVE